MGVTKCLRFRPRRQTAPRYFSRLMRPSRMPRRTLRTSPDDDMPQPRLGRAHDRRRRAIRDDRINSDAQVQHQNGAPAGRAEVTKPRRPAPHRAWPTPCSGSTSGRPSCCTCRSSRPHEDRHILLVHLARASCRQPREDRPALGGRRVNAVRTHQLTHVRPALARQDARDISHELQALLRGPCPVRSRDDCHYDGRASRRVAVSLTVPGDTRARSPDRHNNTSS
jgi:hypothetical protein